MSETTIHGRQLRDGTITDAKLVKVPLHQDGSNAATADISMGTHKITNVVDPAAAQDAATKNYVDNAIYGLKWKSPVRVATVEHGALSTAYENGDTIDGVELATGDRILLKNQNDPEENGIYIVKASGAPDRAADADSAAEVKQMTVMVEAGTANADTQWTCTTDGTIVLGTTELAFVMIGTGVAENVRVFSEVPTGTINGSNTSFTLAQAPATGTLRLFLNGVRLIAGGADYTLSTNTITYVTAPVSGDVHLADYEY